MPYKGLTTHPPWVDFSLNTVILQRRPGPALAGKEDVPNMEETHALKTEDAYESTCG
jgi:hypothetical protein